MTAEQGIQGLGDIVPSLPEEGVVSVLISAGKAEPILALLMVLVVILAGSGLVAFVCVRYFRYAALRNPDAAQTLRAIEKDRQAHERKMAEIKLKSKQPPQRGNKSSPNRHGRK